MVRLWLQLLTLIQMKDWVTMMGLKEKHKIKKPMILKSSVLRKEFVRLDRDISNHITPSGRVKPRQEEAEDLRPHLQLPQGFDPSTVEQQEDGQFCVFKKLSLEGIEKVPVQQCIHRVDTECYSSYVTEYTPTTEEVCSENYSKRCYIELSQRSVEESSELCVFPRERVCTPPGLGEPPREVCQTQYETSCVTKFQEAPVVETVKECQEEDCGMVKKTVVRSLPDTICQKIPFEACAPDNCHFVPGQPQCYNQTQDVTVDSPEEQVYKLVPRLTPKEICKEIPREVCYTSLQEPRQVVTPLLTKWCFTPDTNQVDTEPPRYSREQETPALNEGNNLSLLPPPSSYPSSDGAPNDQFGFSSDNQFAAGEDLATAPQLQFPNNFLSQSLFPPAGQI